MNIGQKGLALIKEFESCHLHAYLDGNNIPTIGWGHTAGVKMGDVCTQEQADAWLELDVSYSSGIVDGNVDLPLNQNQFDALSSFVFNVGPGRKGVRDGFLALKNGHPSTMLMDLNNGDLEGAAAQFAVWNHVNGQPSAGLTRRRKAERELFERPA